MQAFLWRHLVPAEQLKALVYNPSLDTSLRRVRGAAKPATTPTKPPAPTVDPVTGKPKFTKQQVAGLLRQIRLLHQDGLITDAFRDRKIAECEGGQ